MIKYWVYIYTYGIGMDMDGYKLGQSNWPISSMVPPNQPHNNFPTTKKCMALSPKQILENVLKRNHQTLTISWRGGKTGLPVRGNRRQVRLRAVAAWAGPSWHRPPWIGCGKARTMGPVEKFWADVELRFFWLNKYESFHTWGYPQMDGSEGKILLKWMIWRHPYFRKPPYEEIHYTWRV